MTEQRYIVQNRNGVRRTYIYDDDDPDKVVVQLEQDIEPILDGIARDREIMKNDGANKLAARIPVAVYEKAVHEQWDEGDWKKWLNSSEGRAFRIWRGTV